MKNKIIGLLAGVAFFGATANADIALADGLSAYGYIDLVAVDLEGEPRSGDFSEYEIGLSFSPAESQWSAVAELSYGLDDANDTTTDFETVAVTYQHSDALSVIFGNLYTFQGLEGPDAPSNDFISYAGFNGVDSDQSLYGADYAEGIAVTYSVGDINLAAWSEAGSNPNKQYAASYSGIENLTLGVAVIDYNDSTDSTNIHAVYELGDFTISVENVDTDNALARTGALDVTSVAVAYNLGDSTIAVRSVDGDYGVTEYEKTSVAVFHSLSDNVSVGAEYSDQEFGGTETKAVAVELLYVF